MADEMNPQPQMDADTPAASQAAMWCTRVERAKDHKKIKKAFERMREDMKFARGLQWQDQEEIDDPRYVANIVQRHLRTRESALYARNPTAVAKRRVTLDFQVWDGNPASLAEAGQIVAMAQQIDAMVQAGVAPPPEAMALSAQVPQAQAVVADYENGMRRRQQIDRMAKTLEIVWKHQTGEQQPPFKKRMKHVVRRTLTTGVGYLKLGYHRFEEYRPEDVARVTDLSEQIAALRAALAEQQDPDNDTDATSPEIAELENLLQRVQGQMEAFVREGLDFDFPASTSVIVDPACTQLDGFIGARWIAIEYLLTPKQVREVYGVDIGSQYKPHDPEGKRLSDDKVANLRDQAAEKGGMPDLYAMVYEVYDKHLGQTFTVCIGHPEFLIAPKAPDIPLERFWPVFVLTFNGLEDEDEIFPQSDVRLMRHMQMEMNIRRQRLREHTDAARPGYATSKGRLDENDKKALSCRSAHDVVELNGMSENDDIKRLLQSLPTNPIDPNLYDINALQDDVYKVVGTQEAVMGGLSGATATESSIAESSRLSSIGNAVDELDDFLSEVAKAASHILLTEMSVDMVKDIAGPGAVWPEMTRAQAAKDLWLEIRAGSSGRPNKAAEIQNMERMMPLLLQIPGIRPEWLAREALDRLDDRIQIEDAFDPALPSIMSQNRMAQPGTGDPTTDPMEQGVEGRDKNAVEQGDSNLGSRPPAPSRVMDPNRPEQG